MSELGAPWRVRRTGGVLVPGFSKRFDDDGQGVTYLAGIPIGRFAVVARGSGVELDYRRWPIADVLEREPSGAGAIDAAGFIRLPGGRRLRFCGFRLERQSVD